MKVEKKSVIIQKIRQIVKDNEIIVVIHYRGLEDRQIAEIRRDLEKIKSGMIVSKNTLAKLAFTGTVAEKITEKMIGPTAIMYSKNPLCISKVLATKLRDLDKMQYIIGVYRGDVVDLNFINNTALLNSEEDVMARFITILKAPGARILGLLDAKMKKE